VVTTDATQTLTNKSISGAQIDSGTVAVARLGSGSPSASNFLRGDGSWQTVSTTPTTAQVLTAYAGATAGAVGTYVFAQRTGTTTDVNRNDTVAGSTLETVSGLSRNLQETNSAGTTFSRGETGLAGTWRCMGTHDHNYTRSGSGPTGGGATLWLRIS
jgi:hypothetical protein